MAEANPVIIIGLGGTGQWVLTYVKKNLLDTYGKMPDTVRLLAFDTTSGESEAAIAAEEKEEEQARVGDVTLGTGEFIYLGGNIRHICEDIKYRGEHPHISSWLQAEWYLQAQDDDAYDISKGAGQRRPFGRMAVFYDLAGGDPQIINRIDQAITDVKAANERNLPIEIYLVCSLAGGTGAGMFIDVAHITRQLAEAASIPRGFAIRGFLVLQNAFTPVIEVRQVLPNVFAAMRELDRFMLVFDREYPIYYSHHRRDPLRVYHSIYRSKLFDSCYLLDARRPQRPLDSVPPWLGVFPAAADCITALLDPETGSTFDAHYKNVNNELGKAQDELGQPLYSSLGTYTYILPTRDIVARNTYKAALELIGQRLLTVERDESGVLRVTDAGQREISSAPRDEAPAFLRMEKSRDDVQNLPFCQQAMQILGSGRTRDPEFVREIAGLGIEVLNWLLPVEKDDVIQQTAATIQRVLETSLEADVHTSRVYKDDYPSAAARIAGEIERIRRELLGWEEEGGRVVSGRFQKGLDEYLQRDRRRFRRLLTGRLEEILNGVRDDPIVARSGKLPYAQEFLKWLVQALDEFLAFLDAVKEEREKSGELALARDNVERTKQVMFDTRQLTGVLDRLKGTAVRAQEDYIGAENWLLELERQEILYRAVMDLATALKEVALEAKGRVDHWVNLLALGGPVESGEVGVYRYLAEEAAELQRRRDEQRRIRVHEYLTDERYEDELYARCIGERWGEIMHRMRWKMEDGEEGFRLRLLYGNEDLIVAPTRREKATVYNARFLQERLRPYFYEIEQETIADRIREKWRPDGAAKAFLDGAEAMLDFTKMAYKQHKTEKHNFVCVNRGRQITYFDELAEGLKAQASRDKTNQVLGLTNKHRCIVLSTSDLIIGRHTAPYEAASRAYLDYSGDRRLLHNFPAEVNASQYEQRLRRPPIREEQRLLDPKLVALLEDPEMVRRFTLGRFYRLIREEGVAGVSGQSQYVLRLDRLDRYSEEPDRVRLTLPSGRPNLLDAMTTFVYPRVDPDTDVRRIMDVTPGEFIGVEPERVDQAIRRREQSIIEGWEGAVEEFERLLEQNRDLLTEGGNEILIGAFRRLLVEQGRVARRGDEAELPTLVKQFVEENADCLEGAYRSQMEEKFIAFLKACREEGRFATGGRRVLIQRLREYIEKIEPLHKAEKIRRLPEERRPDQITRDLYAIMHMILWDELQRLERLEGQA